MSRCMPILVLGFGRFCVSATYIAATYFLTSLYNNRYGSI
jgi:hypothetical protein